MSASPGQQLVERAARSRSDVLRPMPRRAFARRSTAPIGLAGRRVRLPGVSRWRVMKRAVEWALALSRFLVRVVLDRLRGRRDIETFAGRVRAIFEELGGTAIKMGQQLAARVDLVPFEVCLELNKLLDRVPPFDGDYAVARLEAITGAPLSATFASFEREAFASASVACVFDARLLSGERVAVKVRRPDVAQRFQADLTVVDWVTLLLEWSTLMRPGYFRHFRTELRAMLTEELDFRREGTYQTLFRRYVRKDKLRWLDAPALHWPLCDVDVLVSEFIEGIPCTTILRAVETNDRELLAALEQSDISTDKLSCRSMEISLWGRFERPFYHADPHPGNMIVLPGSRIVMLDFGACGVTSHEHRVLGLEVFRRVVNEDITGTANATIGLLTPLPYVDVPEMRSRFERLFFNFFQGSFTKGSDWWERTTATIWLQMVAITREFDLTLPLEMLRMIRATLLFDTLACRLEPDNNLRSVFGYWMRDANKRAARRRRKRLEKPGLDRTLTTELLSRLGESEDLLAKTSVVANLYARRASIEFMPLSGKSAYVASAVLRFALRTLWLGLWVGLILVAYNAASGRNAGPWDVALGVAQNPGVLFVFAVMLVIGTRRVVQRLSDPEAP